MAELCARDVSYHVNGHVLVRRASFALRPGDFIALLGPNGAGKTSLIKAAMGLLPIHEGSATLDGVDCASLNARARARHLAYLPQRRDVEWPVKVRDVVSVGRYSYGTGMGYESAGDRLAIDAALDACDLTHLAERSMDTLSGGEASRVHCARALSAETPLLIADEPTGALDPRHAFQLMDILRNYVDRGGAALVILHDLALAARYADQLLWMKNGEIIAGGATESVLTAELCAEVYGVNAEIRGRDVLLRGPL